MSRARGLRSCAVVAAIAAAVVALPAQAPAATPAGAPTATLVATPATVRFGDTLVLRADVRVPEGGDAVVLLDPAPLTMLAPATATRRDDDGATVITVTQRVACLSPACVGAGPSKAVPAGRVSVRRDGTTLAVTVEPVRVVVSGRVDPALARRPTGGYRIDTAVPEPTPPVAPGTLVALLVAGAAVALLAALALLWPDARRRQARALVPTDVDAFARAVRLLRESAGRAAPDRRRAADLVARIARGGRDEQGRTASAIAWSRPEPAPADALGLADALEREPRRHDPVEETP